MGPIIQWLNFNILIPTVLCFIFGIVTGHFFPLVFSQNSIPLLLGLLSGFGAALYFSRYKQILFICLPLFFLLGYANIIHHNQSHLQDGHIAATLKNSCQVTLLGTLADMVEQGKRKNSFDLEVQKMLIHQKKQAWQNVHGKVHLSFHGSTEGLQPGTLIMVLAKVGPITNFNTPGAFDYKGYMAAKNIHVSGWIKNRQDIIPVLHGQKRIVNKLKYLPEQARQYVARFLRKYLPRETAGLYQALLVGSRKGVEQDILEQFKATGTMHLLAISGLHMGLLGLMIGTVLNWLLRRSEWLLLHTYVPGLALLGTLPVLLGYGFIAGMNIPVLRALVMAIILLSAIMLRKRYDLLHLIAAAALFILVFQPAALFTVSFQLSFAAVTAMALFLPKFDPTSTHHSKSLRGHGLIWRYSRTALLISFTATIGTLPFMLYHFNRFSLIGPLMNLIVEPLLCFWALPLGLLAIPCMFLVPKAAILLLQAGSLALHASIKSTAFAAAIPFASIWTITPEIREILLYGGLVFLWYWRKKKPGVLLPIIAIGGCLLFVHFTAGLFRPAHNKRSEVCFLDVGQGSSTFLHLPNGSRVLVDGGGSRNSSFNTGERIIGPYLWHQRIWRLDQAVITHPHSDHFNGMDFLLKHFHPKILYINGDTRSEGNYVQILEQAQKLGITIQIPQAGQMLDREENFHLLFLGMNGLPVRADGQVNDKCLVLRYEHGKRSFFLPADISSKAEHILRQKWKNLRSDVLLAPHHGSATSSSQEFIEAVNPSIIIVSAGKNGRRYYPDPANLAHWQQRGILTFITRDQGTITCTTDGYALGCSSWLEEKQPGNRKEIQIRSQ